MGYPVHHQWRRVRLPSPPDSSLGSLWGRVSLGSGLLGRVSLGSDRFRGSDFLWGHRLSLGSDRFRGLSLDFFGVRPIWTSLGLDFFGVRTSLGLDFFGVRTSLGSGLLCGLLWGQTDGLLWGQTDLDFFGVRTSLGSDRFRIFLTVTDFGGLDVGIPQAMRRSIDFAANSHGIGAG